MAVNRRINKRIEKRSFFSSRKDKGWFPKNTDNTRERNFKIALPGSGFLSVAAWVGRLSICAILLAVLSLGLLVGYKYVTNCGYFAIKEVAVSGNFRLHSREILETCRIGMGGNLLAVKIDELKTLLTQSPWIEEASVRRVLPDVLSINIKEREPCFWIEQNGLLYYADANGNRIAPVQTGYFTSFPTLVVEPGAEEFQQKLPELVQSLAKAALPIDMASVSWLRLGVGGGVELYLESTDLKIMIYQDGWQENLDHLALALSDLARRGELKGISNARAQSGNVWVRKG